MENANAEDVEFRKVTAATHSKFSIDLNLFRCQLGSICPIEISFISLFVNSLLRTCGLRLCVRFFVTDP